MTEPIGVQALTPNPALELFAVLIGEWRTSGTHPLLPGAEIRGRADPDAVLALCDADAELERLGALLGRPRPAEPDRGQVAVRDHPAEFRLPDGPDAEGPRPGRLAPVPRRGRLDQVVG